MNCVCGHSLAAHQEITTPRGFASGDCTGGGSDPETRCTCSYFEPDRED